LLQKKDRHFAKNKLRTKYYDDFDLFQETIDSIDVFGNFCPPGKRWMAK